MASIGAARRIARARTNAPAINASSRGDIAAKLDALGCDPIVIMARIAMDESHDPKLRAAMAKDLAGYLFVATGDDNGERAPPLGEVIAAAWRKPAAKRKRA